MGSVAFEIFHFLVFCGGQEIEKNDSFQLVWGHWVLVNEKKVMKKGDFRVHYWVLRTGTVGLKNYRGSDLVGCES